MADFDNSVESRKRTAPSPANSVSSQSKRSKSTKSPNTEKSSRGLRHFATMVCKKVEKKGTTTYDEVASELVQQVVEERQANGSSFDAKNIRRRVYDALNVLRAMDIIRKDKKEITWRGLPTAESQDLEALKDEIENTKGIIHQKREAMQDLLVQYVSFRNLIWHNDQNKAREQEKIPIPFLVVNTNNAAIIQCDMSRDRSDVMFNFSMPFEINDDNAILKKLKFDKTSIPLLRELIPDDMLNYCDNHNILDAVVNKDYVEQQTNQRRHTHALESSTSRALEHNQLRYQQQEQHHQSIHHRQDQEEHQQHHHHRSYSHRSYGAASHPSHRSYPYNEMQNQRQRYEHHHPHYPQYYRSNAYPPTHGPYDPTRAEAI